MSNGNPRARFALALLAATCLTPVAPAQAAPGDRLGPEFWETPPLTTMESVYRYVIRPIYAVFPKPGELDNSISYLLTERETIDLGGPGRDDLSAAQLKIDPWAPVWSSLMFVLVMLGIACVYLKRQDF